MYVCSECHKRDKSWTKCIFEYGYHAEWKFIKCEICGKGTSGAVAQCKAYDYRKKLPLKIGGDCI